MNTLILSCTLSERISNNEILTIERSKYKRDSTNRIKELIENHIPEVELDKIIQKAEHINHQLILADSSILTIFDPLYPDQLKRIKNPPVLLYVKGKQEILRESKVAIVGARNTSKKGKEIAFNLAKTLDTIGFNIISGLAVGTDTAAHKGSIQASGRTTAVLPSGFQKIYPSANKDLVNKILQNGLLLSEYQPQQEPSKNQFIDRDRIQSGLSGVVIVVEAEINGGTMHTARFAQEQNRDLIVIDYDRDIDTTRGNQVLIKDGARAVKADRLHLLPDMIKNLSN